MTRAEAAAEVATLAKASTPPVVSAGEIDAALTDARLRDNAGRPPSDPDFVEENWDLNYAVAECYELKAVRQLEAGTVSKFSSEGASFETKAPDYMAVADWWRDRSTVGDGFDSPVFVEMDDRTPRAIQPRSALELEC